MDMDAIVGKRLMAARIQGGYQRREELTARVALPRFGKQVLGQVERGERPLHDYEAEALAKVLPVDADWLLAHDMAGQGDGDFSRFREHVAEMTRKLDENQRMLRQILDKLATEQMANETEELEALPARDDAQPEASAEDEEGQDSTGSA